MKMKKLFINTIIDNYSIIILLSLISIIICIPVDFETETKTLFNNDDEIQSNNNNNNNDSSICLTNQCIYLSGQFLSSIDQEIDPCNNFYQFSCGRWILEHPIPKYGNHWDQFQSFALSIKNHLKKHLENKTTFNSNLTIIYEKLYEFYNGCNDKKQRNKNGYESIYQIIDNIGGWPMLDGHQWEHRKSANHYRWENAYVELSRLGQQYLIGIEPIIDFRNTSKTIIKLGPPYKTSENIINLMKKSKILSRKNENDNNLLVGDQLEQTKQLYMKMLKLIRKNRTKSNHSNNNDQLNDDELMSDINKMINLQIQLQNDASQRHSMVYFQENYEKHLLNISTIKSNINFDISYILEGIFGRNFTDDEVLFVLDIEFLKQLSPLLLDTPNRVLANYISTNIAFQLSRHTTIEMLELLVSKLDSPEVLSNICFMETSNYLPELLGKLYTDLYFNKNSRGNIGSMAQMLRDSFRQLLKQSEWMDTSTINEAVKKLDSMAMNIAYPDWYNNDTFLMEKYLSMYEDINSTNYIQSVINVLRTRQNQSNELMNNEMIAKANSTDHSTIWPMLQITDVNAFYYFTTNGVYLPAGIIQDDIYMADLPSAITFGSIGMILGHEMTHAFDNSGQLYDEHGELRNWWTNQTRKLFAEKADCFVDQYSNFSINSAKVNGLQTLAENIADNGGLREAYRAFKTNEHNGNNKRLPGAMSKYTPDQLFFISFAHMWCTNMDQNAAINIIENSVHSPPSVRVLGSLANFEQFSHTFNCPINKPMNPEKKCVLW
ncbi:neprilysin-1-like [Dermatophagoides pteronyssinus]|uniref:neprilysin-1-like n=1 Tax=Dermatophagoides pteronyssinus TaxID=6956 RepID=UPI003F664304